MKWIKEKIKTIQREDQDLLLWIVCASILVTSFTLRIIVFEVCGY